MALISFNSTKAAYNILKRRLSIAVRTFNIFVHIVFTLLYIYYLIFNNEALNVYIYSILLAVNIASFVFMFVFQTNKGDDSRVKFRKRQNKLLAKNITNIFKYGVKIFAIVYTFIEMNENTSDLTKILNYLSAFLTFILLLFEVLANVVNKYINLFMLGFEKDMNESKVVSIYKKFTKEDVTQNRNYSKGEEKILETLNKEIESMHNEKMKRKLNIIEKKMLELVAKNYEKKAFKLIGKTDKIIDLLEKAQEKIKNDENAVQLVKLNDFIDILYDYVYGNYKDVSEENISTMIGTLIYYLSPDQAIYDKKSILGHIEDSHMLDYSLEKVEDTLNKYNQWKKKDNKK